MEYIDSEKCAIAFVHKAYSESICKAEVYIYRPWEVENWEGEAATQDDGFWRNHIIQTDKPVKPTVMLMREPIQRALSRYCMMVEAGWTDLTVDQFLEMLENHNDPCLQRQSDYVVDSPDIKIFRAPDQIAEFCAYVGYDKLDIENAGTLPKPELTENQLQILQNYYAPCIELWNQIGS